MTGIVETFHGRQGGGLVTSRHERAYGEKDEGNSFVLTNTRTLRWDADKAGADRYQEIKNTRDTNGHEGTRS